MSTNVIADRSRDLRPPRPDGASRITSVSRERLSDRASPRRTTYPKPGPRSPMGYLARAIQELITVAQDGHDTSRQRKALLERVRRMLRAARTQ